MKNKPIVIITGEPKSIFFEILFKSIKKKKIHSPLILICNKDILFSQMKYFKFKKKIKILHVDEIKNSKLDNNYLNIIDVEIKCSSINNLKKNMIKSYIEETFNIAFKIIKKKITNKFINGPINKKTFLNDKFLGITEFVSDKFKKKNTAMLIYNKTLSICPLTTHLPLKNVSKNIKKELISKNIEIINYFFRSKLKVKPKIGVTCLNPHCESVLKVNEDQDILPKIIKEKVKKGINIKGPYPTDTIFLKQNRKKFNVILGMYHDQVLGPFKTIFEYDAINVTMGLPFFRVTPDHGPNIKMIGKNKSNPLSLIRSLEFLDKR